MSELRTPLKAHLREDLDQITEERIWRNVRAAVQSAPMDRRRRVWAVSAMGLAAAAAVLVAVRSKPQSVQSPAVATAIGPLFLSDGSSLHSAHASGGELAMKAPDGTTLTLANGATLEVLSNGAGEVRLRQPEGRVAYDITPGGPRRWTIESGPVVVEVVGTSFVVERDANHVQVDVSRGHVVVRGEGVTHGVENLLAGGHVDVRLQPSAEAVVAPSSPDAVRPAAAPSVRKGAGQGTTLGETVPNEPAQHVQIASIGELLAQADAARLSPHPSDAARPLQQLLEAYPKDARAPLAAFTLGQVYLRVGDNARASHAFERALAGELSEPVRAEATRMRDLALMPGWTAPPAAARRIELLTRLQSCADAAWSTGRLTPALRTELAGDYPGLLINGAARTGSPMLSLASADCARPEQVTVQVQQGTKQSSKVVDLSEVTERDREQVLAIVARQLLATIF